MNEKISIIIPVYNAAEFLPKCIESCLNQTYNNIEIIIVIDGSPDNCFEIAKKYQEKDNRIIVHNQENRGLPNSRRIGFDISTGAYIYHLDNDDYIEPNAIALLYNRINSEDADMVIGGAIYEDKEGKFITNWINKFSGTDKADFLRLMFNSTIQPSIWGRLIKRKIFDPVFVPHHYTLGEDYLANVMMVCFAPKIKIICEPALLHHYIVYSGSLTNTTKDDNWMLFTDDIAEILCANNLEEVVMNEWAYFRVINCWRNYLRVGGKNILKNKEYVKDFYDKYYSLVKVRLPFAERFELSLYRYNQLLGWYFSRIYGKYIKWTKQITN